jgi:hypothetical protein
MEYERVRWMGGRGKGRGFGKRFRSITLNAQEKRGLPGFA